MNTCTKCFADDVCFNQLSRCSRWPFPTAASSPPPAAQPLVAPSPTLASRIPARTSRRKSAEPASPKTQVVSCVCTDRESIHATASLQRPCERPHVTPSHATSHAHAAGTAVVRGRGGRRGASGGFAKGVSNHENITKFNLMSCGGAGRRGRKASTMLGAWSRAAAEEGE